MVCPHCQKTSIYKVSVWQAESKNGVKYLSGNISHLTEKERLALAKKNSSHESKLKPEGKNIDKFF